LTALIAAMFLIMPAGVANAEVTQRQLKDARAEMNAKATELDSQLNEFEQIQLVQTSYETRIAVLEDQILARDREIALSRLAAREQAQVLYMDAGSSSDHVLSDPESITFDGARHAYLSVVTDTDTDAVNRLEFLQQDQSRLQDQLRDLAAQQEDLANQAFTLGEVLTRQLSAANDEYQALYSQWQKEEAERQRKAREAAKAKAAAAAAASAAASSYTSSAFVDPSGRTCPVAGANTFRDSWLEPRDYRNGLHHGTDMVAAAGTPEVAIESGTIWVKNYHWAGGNQLYIRGNSGDIYYYAHMQGYAPGISVGTQVGVGQVVGYVGSTGASSVSHLHLGYQPGGGPLVNPYQLLVKLCR